MLQGVIKSGVCISGNTCYKTYTVLTGTQLVKLRHKEILLDFAQDLTKSKTIRESAKHCEVDKSTTLRWRHRMLNNPKRLIAKYLHGIVEFDETYFLESHKGERNLYRKPRKRGGSAKEYLKDKIYYIQNVNAYDSRFKSWVKHFN